MAGPLCGFDVVPSGLGSMSVIIPQVETWGYLPKSPSGHTM